jgi:predicted transcriptional regulator
MMSENDIVRAVRSIRYSSKRLRNQRRAASVNALAAAAGVTRKCVYEVAQRGTMSPETADKLRSALSLIGSVP